MAARAMRQILIESARLRRADKRRGQKVTLDEGLLAMPTSAAGVVAKRRDRRFEDVGIGVARYQGHPVILDSLDMGV